MMSNESITLSNNLSTEDEAHTTTEGHASADYLPLVSIIAILIISIQCNSLVIVAFFRDARLRVIFNLFAVHLATADLLISILVIIALIDEITQASFLGRWSFICQACAVLTNALPVEQLVLTHVICNDRHRAMQRRMSYTRRSFQWHIEKLILFLTWVVSFVGSFLITDVMSTVRLYGRGTCKFPGRLLYISYTSFLHFAILVSLAIFTVCIIWDFRKRRHKNPQFERLQMELEDHLNPNPSCQSCNIRLHNIYSLQSLIPRSPVHGPVHVPRNFISLPSPVSQRPFKSQLFLLPSHQGQLEFLKTKPRHSPQLQSPFFQHAHTSSFHIETYPNSDNIIVHNAQSPQCQKTRLELVHKEKMIKLDEQNEGDHMKHQIDFDESKFEQAINTTDGINVKTEQKDQSQYKTHGKEDQAVEYVTTKKYLRTFLQDNVDNQYRSSKHVKIGDVAALKGEPTELKSLMGKGNHEYYKNVRINDKFVQTVQEQNDDKEKRGVNDFTEDLLPASFSFSDDELAEFPQPRLRPRTDSMYTLRSCLSISEESLSKAPDAFIDISSQSKGSASNVTLETSMTSHKDQEGDAKSVIINDVVEDHTEIKGDFLIKEKTDSMNSTSYLSKSQGPSSIGPNESIQPGISEIVLQFKPTEVYDVLTSEEDIYGSHSKNLSDGKAGTEKEKQNLADVDMPSGAHEIQEGFSFNVQKVAKPTDFQSFVQQEFSASQNDKMQPQHYSNTVHENTESQLAIHSDENDILSGQLDIKGNEVKQQLEAKQQHKEHGRHWINKDIFLNDNNSAGSKKSSDNLESEESQKSSDKPDSEGIKKSSDNHDIEGNKPNDNLDSEGSIKSQSNLDRDGSTKSNDNLDTERSKRSYDNLDLEENNKSRDNLDSKENLASNEKIDSEGSMTSGDNFESARSAMTSDTFYSVGSDISRDHLGNEGNMKLRDIQDSAGSTRLSDNLDNAKNNKPNENLDIKCSKKSSDNLDNADSIKSNDDFDSAGISKPLHNLYLDDSKKHQKVNDIVFESDRVIVNNTSLQLADEHNNVLKTTELMLPEKTKKKFRNLSCASFPTDTVNNRHKLAHSVIDSAMHHVGSSCENRLNPTTTGSSSSLHHKQPKEHPVSDISISYDKTYHSDISTNSSDDVSFEQSQKDIELAVENWFKFYDINLTNPYANSECELLSDNQYMEKLRQESFVPQPSQSLTCCEALVRARQIWLDFYGIEMTEKNTPSLTQQQSRHIISVPADVHTEDSYSDQTTSKSLDHKSQTEWSSINYRSFHDTANDKIKKTEKIKIIKRFKEILKLKRTKEHSQVWPDNFSYELQRNISTIHHQCRVAEDVYKSKDSVRVTTSFEGLKMSITGNQEHAARGSTEAGNEICKINELNLSGDGCAAEPSSTSGSKYTSSTSFSSRRSIHHLEEANVLESCVTELNIQDTTVVHSGITPLVNGTKTFGHHGIMVSTDNQVKQSVIREMEKLRANDASHTTYKVQMTTSKTKSTKYNEEEKTIHINAYSKHQEDSHIATSTDHNKDTNVLDQTMCLSKKLAETNNHFVVDKPTNSFMQEKYLLELEDVNFSDHKRNITEAAMTAYDILESMSISCRAFLVELGIYRDILMGLIPLNKELLQLKEIKHIAPCPDCKRRESEKELKISNEKNATKESDENATKESDEKATKESDEKATKERDENATGCSEEDEMENTTSNADIVFVHNTQTNNLTAFPNLDAEFEEISTEDNQERLPQIGGFQDMDQEADWSRTVSGTSTMKTGNYFFLRVPREVPHQILTVCRKFSFEELKVADPELCILLSLICIVLLQLICWFPIAILYMIFDVTGFPLKPSRTELVFLWLWCLRMVIQPLLYVCYSKYFRENYVQLLRCQCRS